MKNNKIAIICVGILAASSQLLAISNDELLKRLEQLESEVGGLKKSIKGEMQKEIGSIENRMDSIETSVLLNKINWGLGLKNRVDFYDTKKVDGSKSHSGNVWTTKLHLNMDSQITDDMKFTGRLAMYKYWSGNTVIGNANQMAMYDPMQGRAPADSSIFAERAYLDYTLNKDSLVPVTITLGRQPSSDGPSHQFKDNTVRKSTYSALGFDGAADGIVATADFEKATGIENAAVRLAYGKGYQAYNTSGSMSQYVDRNTDVKDALFYAMFIDGAIPALKGSLLQLGYVKAMDVTGMTGGANLGSIDLFGLMAEFTNIADTGLDLFAHYGISKTRSNGSFVNVNGVNYGLLSSQPMGDLGVDRTGNAFWVGGRYALPFSFKGKIGYEYNRGSQYWTSFTSAANDLTNKLATRGNAHEVYYIQPLNRYAHLRAGAQFIKYDYAGSGFHLGTPMKLGDAGTAREIENLANYYLMFNLLF